jgi:type IV secretory pathway VirB4 component
MSTKLDKNSKPTQDFVPIKEVRDGVLILKDGSMRVVLLVTSINFSLKSPDEQSSVIMQFQNFLNSLDFSAQIFIESKRMDIRPYLAILEERLKVQINDLMKIQIVEYIKFVKEFTEQYKIMTKSFFIIIPYSPTIISSKSSNPLKNLFGKKAPTLQEKTKDFEENRLQLEQRIGIVQQGLGRCGLRSIVLGTEELVELFYKLFNPGDNEKPIKMN